MTRNARVLGVLSVVLLVCLQFRVGVLALVTGDTAYHFEDIDAFFLPLWTECARAWRAGSAPLWSEHAWSGLPLASDPQAGAFYPPHIWMWKAWPHASQARLYASAVLVHALWAALGMFGLCSARGRSIAASVLAALSLGLGGYLVLEVRHVHFVEAIAWVPWLAWATHALGTRATLGRAALLALVVAFAWATGGVSMLFYAAWFVGALVAARLRGRALLLCAVAVAVGTLLAWPTLAPMLLHVAWSPRAEGMSYALASSMSWSGLSALPSLFVPNYYGQNVLGTYTGGGTQWEVAGYYAGMLPFALAVVALALASRRDPIAWRERVFLAILFVLAVCFALGDNTPLHRFAYQHLPLFDSMRCPPRALILFSLAIPLLAADGLDAIAARLSSRAMQVFFALAVFATALDLSSTHRRENPGSPVASELASDARAFLSAPARARDRYIQDVHLPHALHNSGLLWGLPSAGGYSSLPIWRYLHLLWISNHGAIYPHPQLSDDLAAQGIWRFDAPWVDALAIRWIVAPSDPDGDGAHYRRHTQSSDGIDVYENKQAYPRAWIVHRARTVTTAREAATAVADARFDPAREVVLEGVTPSLAPTDAAEPVTIARDGQDFVYDVTLASPGVLVMAEPIYRGWSARVDGKDAPLYAADLALRAIALQPGPHHIEVRISRRALLLGW